MLLQNTEYGIPVVLPSVTVQHRLSDSVHCVVHGVQDCSPTSLVPILSPRYQNHYIFVIIFCADFFISEYASLPRDPKRKMGRTYQQILVAKRYSPAKPHRRTSNASSVPVCPWSCRTRSTPWGAPGKLLETKNAKKIGYANDWVQQYPETRPLNSFWPLLPSFRPCPNAAFRKGISTHTALQKVPT